MRYRSNIKLPLAPRIVPSVGTKHTASSPRVVRQADDIINMISKQFPGTQDGASIEAVRNYIRNQARMKGFRLTGAVGSTNVFNIDISGTAKFLLGHLFPVNFDADITLTVNEEIILQKTSVASLVPSVNPRGTTDWFIINRPLSGTDEIQLAVQSFAAYSNTPYAVYFI